MIKRNRRTLVAAIVLAAVCQASSAQSDPLYELIQAVAPETVHVAARTERADRSPRQDNGLIQQIAERWKRSPSQIQRIVDYAKAHAQPDFPRLPHLLAIMAVESRFDPRAKSQGNVGLMQINVSANGDRLRNRSPEENVRVGAEILREGYFQLKGSHKGAVLSYNTGLGAYRQGRRNLDYWRKYKQELEWLKDRVEDVCSDSCSVPLSWVSLS
jgi:soluble lytic murein transglycosylase-like protein